MAGISPERKILYYSGLALIVIGVILFISTFFSFAGSMSSPHSMMPGMDGNFNPGGIFIRAVIGIILIIAGGVLTSIGAKGAAGSGIILDPGKAREDLKPFNQAKGKMINDVLDNIDVVDSVKSSLNAKEVVRVRCRSCSTLNEEDARFCKGCGSEF